VYGGGGGVEDRHRARGGGGLTAIRTPVATAAGRRGQNSASPVEHRERIRHSNLLERTFGESRRRVKVIGRLPGENTCRSLVWAVLDRASVGRRGLDTSSAGIRQLQDLRRQLLGPPELLATG
jgi:transposase-like protein